MLRTRTLISTGVLLAGGVLLSAATSSAEKPASAAAAAHNAVFDQQTFWQTTKVYCDTCHFGPKARAKLNLESLDLSNLGNNGETWEKVLRKLRNREMPPVGNPRPQEATYQALVAAIESERDRVAEVRPNPGRPTLHRLNRTEYANAVRDLLALEIDVSELLPADDIGYGFDNIGDVLQVSPVLLERYLSAARKISRTAVGDMTLPPSYQTYTIPHGLIQDDRLSETAPVGSRGGTAIRHFFPVDGEYEISVTLQRNRNDEYLGLERERKLDLRLDDQRLQLFTIPASKKKIVLGGGTPPDADLKARLSVKAGAREIGALFLKDTLLQEGIIDKVRDDDVKTYFEGVGSVTVAGPFNVEGPGHTVTRDKIFICHPSGSTDEMACAEKILSNLAHRAYRRPVSADDMPQLLALYKEGAENGGFETGVRLALQKILVSPEFLFRAEIDPPNAAPGTVYRVSDIELASRLSFFLWSSIPDDELLAVAEKGQLHDPAVLKAQVKRMMADARSESLIKNFVGQWLFLRNVSRISPDTTTFMTFDENLRRSMAKETELLVESQVREDHSVVDLLSTDYTFLNQRMAEHYGIKGIYGNEFRRVKLDDPRRYGLLGQASILAVTSYPNRTAPTIRGKWVLEQLLGTPPPPPPPNVPSLKDDQTTQKLTMRQRMEMHRASPQCAACHRMTDPLGFALDNFDGIGSWRDNTGPGTGPIDSSGTLPDGTPFNGPEGLRKVLVKKRDMFVENFTERLLTYALGRGVEEYDHSVIRKITREASADDQKWSSIILGIVNSTPFQMRRTKDGNL
jgi:Protein of unknown function (DUF1592)/Protein of unknown function (DUF1588)/Protein of unknown function (DUF1587)/Protein of unknown function (DUF1585)/Protein of unknown function (DUF1595)